MRMTRKHPAPGVHPPGGLPDQEHLSGQSPQISGYHCRIIDNAADIMARNNLAATGGTSSHYSALVCCFVLRRRLL